jgi:hypothetical protein
MQDTIAVVFDFDDTLAPDSTSSFLASKGLDVKRFWREDVQPLLDSGWDPIPAYLYRMILLSESGSLSITRADLAAWGQKIKPFNGVSTLFRRLRTHLASVGPGVQIEFYLIRLLLQSCKLFFSGLGSPGRGSIRNTTCTWSWATSTRVTKARILSRFRRQSAAANPSGTCAAKSSSRPMIRRKSVCTAASSASC